MRSITVPSNAVALRSDRELTPAMVSVAWEIASALDGIREPPDPGQVVWLRIPTAHLRGEGARNDNVWLRECLDRLTGVKLSGEYRGDPWGAVLLAEWHIEEGGSMARILIPPAGVYALRSPSTFAKIEAYAAHRLTGHGRQLYAILADKKRMGRPSWIFTLEEIRALMGVENQKSYDRFNNFRARVLDPAVEAVNDYGTVKVKMTPQKRGRSVHAVRFDWTWRDPRDAEDTVVQNDRHTRARRKAQTSDDAPPLIEDEAEAAKAWWASLSAEEQEAWAKKIGREAEIGGQMQARPERIIRAMAFRSRNPR